MAKKEGGAGGINWIRWVIIIGGVILLIFAVLALVFIFLLPSFFSPEGAPPELPEILMRLGIIVGTFIVGVIIVIGIVVVVYEIFFKKKELHVVKEHAKIIKEASMLNPTPTLGSLVMTGKSQIQQYQIGKIVGHTQVPVKFERYVHLDENGKENIELSETPEELEERRGSAIKSGRDRYDFFAFITQRGIYALPLFNLLESPKIFACYPTERSPDLVGDVEIHDIGTWKYYNIHVPAQRAQEPMVTLEDFKAQIMPIVNTSLIDYIGLVAQRGIEGDTSMQKWLEAKATQVNVKQSGD